MSVSRLPLMLTLPIGSQLDLSLWLSSNLLFGACVCVCVSVCVCVCVCVGRAKTQSRTETVFKHRIMPNWGGRVRGKERDRWFNFVFLCYFVCLCVCARVCVYLKSWTMLNAWRKCHLQKDDVRKIFSVSENHHEQCTIPRAAKQLPDRARWGEGGREGRKLG